MQFEVRVSSPQVFEDVIKIYNGNYNTNFEVIETIYDELPLCKVQVTKYVIEDVFGLATMLSAFERKMKEEGKLAW